MILANWEFVKLVLQKNFRINIEHSQGWEFALLLIGVIAQVAQDKRATMSNSLRSLRGNEQMSNSLKKIWLKKSKILFFLNFFSMFNIRFSY